MGLNGVEFLVTEVLRKGMLEMEDRGERLKGCVILVSRIEPGQSQTDGSTQWGWFLEQR